MAFLEEHEGAFIVIKRSERGYFEARKELLDELLSDGPTRASDQHSFAAQSRDRPRRNQLGNKLAH